MDCRILQVSNICPTATNEQVKTLFSYVGQVEECRLYPTDTSAAVTQPRIAYVKFDNKKYVGVGQHLTNTVFLDRALICVPAMSDTIPEEQQALLNAGTQASLFGQRTLPSHLIQQEQVQEDGTKLLITIDPMMKNLGVPQYPPLPGDTEASKVEEIRRTIYVGNLDKAVDGEDLMNFFSTTIGEVMYLVMAQGNDNLPCAYAYVEFTNQSAVPLALQNDGIEYRGRPLKIQHSKVAIIKPQRKTVDQAIEEVEEAIKNKDKGKGMASDRLPPPEPRAIASRSRSPAERWRRSPSGRDRDRRRRSPSYSRSPSRSSSRSRSPRDRHRDRGEGRDRRRRDGDRHRRRTRSRSYHSRSPSPRDRGKRRDRDHDREDRHRHKSERSPRPSRYDKDRDRGDRRSDRSERREKERERKREEAGQSKVKNELLHWRKERDEKSKCVRTVKESKREKEKLKDKPSKSTKEERREKRSEKAVVVKEEPREETKEKEGEKKERRREKDREKKSEKKEKKRSGSASREDKEKDREKEPRKERREKESKEKKSTSTPTKPAQIKQEEPDSAIEASSLSPTKAEKPIMPNTGGTDALQRQPNSEPSSLPTPTVPPSSGLEAEDDDEEESLRERLLEKVKRRVYDRSSMSGGESMDTS